MAILDSNAFIGSFIVALGYNFVTALEGKVNIDIIIRKIDNLNSFFMINFQILINFA